VSFWSRIFGRAGEEPVPPQPVRPRLREDGRLGQEHLPPQAAPIAGLVDPDVLLIACEIHGIVIDPATDQPWRGQRKEPLVRSAYSQAVTQCQQQAVELSKPHDQEALHRVNAADRASRDAKHAMAESAKVHDETVIGVDGAAVTARAAIAGHAADEELAAERAVSGDHRHAERPFDRVWVILASGIFAVLDLLLLWRPALGLSGTLSSTMIFKWGMAFFMAAAQMLFVDFAVLRFRSKEQISTDRRNAVLDSNRAIELRRPSRLAPRPQQVDEADDGYRGAIYLLIAAAMAMGLIGASRVAKILRGGSQSVMEATLFGALIGMFFAGLVLLVGWLACRGNSLGRRLREGAQVVDGIRARQESIRAAARSAGTAARRQLALAGESVTLAAEHRAYVVSAYQQAMQLVTGWLGLDQPPQETEVTVTRELLTRNEFDGLRSEVEARLTDVETWLAGGTVTAEVLPALTGATDGPTEPGRELALRVFAGRTIVPLEQSLEPKPRTPLAVLAAGLVMVASTAFLTAYLIEPTITATALAVLGGS
jgi:hypothetical protein